jgi:non-specific serine/threonine protein kinase
MSPQRTIRSAPHNLPAPLTSLIGRARESQAIADALRATRLVTITGPGGVGKTRLALELASGQRGRRRDGVWIVDLAQGSEPPDVAAETARALDVRSPAASGATAALRRYLAGRDVLLVFDNCEQVADACAQLAAELLGSCADVRIMATSRESLGVTGETVWRLEPLDGADAQRLFVERARQREPGFMPDRAADAAIAQLCERLDRLPLAIELAAARVSVMSPGEILASLEPSLGELGGGGRLVPPHHRTVRAAVTWSEQLLDDDERRAFRRLAVFVGGFDAAAARAVAPGLSVDMLARLVDKSLVAVLRSARGATRYRLLETIREHARELLVAAAVLDDAHARHLRHFAALVGPVGEGWPSPAAKRLVDDLGDDYENVRAAIEWGAGADPVAAMRLLASARELFQMLGQSDGVRLARLLLDRHRDRDRDRLETQIVAGALMFHLGEAQATSALLGEAQELAVELGEPGPEGWARLFLGLNAALAGDVGEAREQLEASRALHRRLGIRSGEARATSLLGLTHAIAGDVTPRAKELIEEAIAINVADGDGWGEGQCHVHLGIVVESDPTDARGPSWHYRKAVELLRPFRDGTLLPVALVGQGLAIARRDPARALRVAAAAFAMRARIGGDFAPFYRRRAERLRATAEAAVGDDAERLWREGERLDADDAIALAFGAAKRPRAPAAAAAAGGLSAREQEVARLVAAGLSNKQIAAQLQLSVRTVESHVRRALSATGLSNRTQLATWARERIQ